MLQLIRVSFGFSLLMRCHKIEIIPCRFFSASSVSLLVHINFQDRNDYCGFSFEIHDCQSLYSAIRNLLEAHESVVISVWGYDREKENQSPTFQPKN